MPFFEGKRQKGPIKSAGSSGVLYIALCNGGGAGGFWTAMRCTQRLCCSERRKMVQRARFEVRGYQGFFMLLFAMAGTRGQVDPGLPCTAQIGCAVEGEMATGGVDWFATAFGLGALSRTIRV